MGSGVDEIKVNDLPGHGGDAVLRGTDSAFLRHGCCGLLVGMKTSSEWCEGGDFLAVKQDGQCRLIDIVGTTEDSFSCATASRSLCGFYAVSTIIEGRVACDQVT